MATYFGSSRGNRRKFEDNLNLVPFIDLFSTLIIFLLMTAVWDQLAVIQANLGQQAGGSQVAPKDVVKSVKQNVRITVGPDTLELFDNGKTDRINRVGGVFDVAALTNFVSSVREKYGPEKSDLVIFSTDDARYEDLVLVMDQCLAKNFKELVVSGTAEALRGGTKL